MENLVQRDGEEEAAAIIVFPKLISYKLQEVRNLASFRIEWPSIREIKRYHFPKLKTFGSNIQSQKPELGSTSELDPPVFFCAMPSLYTTWQELWSKSYVKPRHHQQILRKLIGEQRGRYASNELSQWIQLTHPMSDKINNNT